MHMRRSRLIALGYVVAGVLFLVNAVTGAAINTEQRVVTWGVLGVIWFLFSIYAVLNPDQFDNEQKTKSENKSESETAIGFNFMFTVVLVLLLILGGGALLQLIIS